MFERLTTSHCIDCDFFIEKQNNIVTPQRYAAFYATSYLFTWAPNEVGCIKHFIYSAFINLYVTPPAKVTNSHVLHINMYTNIYKCVYVCALRVQHIQATGKIRKQNYTI